MEGQLIRGQNKPEESEKEGKSELLLKAFSKSTKHYKKGLWHSFQSF